MGASVSSDVSAKRGAKVEEKLMGEKVSVSVGRKKSPTKGKKSPTKGKKSPTKGKTSPKRKPGRPKKGKGRGRPKKN